MNTSNSSVSLYSLVQHLTHQSYKNLKNFSETVENYDVQEKKKILKGKFKKRIKKRLFSANKREVYQIACYCKMVQENAKSR
jgi:hypothetical protein